MSLIPEELIDQIRDSADILGVISESVELKRTGSDWRGPCPFHGGTHRNFAVVPRKGLFYCYVCHEAGDVFSYLMKRFGMDYPTAVREVARRSGITVPDRTERTGPDPREPLFAAVSAAQSWFARQLLDEPVGKAALNYLAGRDLSREVVAPLGLGFAPGGNAFLSYMGELGIGEPVLLEAGLAVRRDDGRMFPRFRQRLLFPIHDLRGRPVGFGGRLLGPGEPKYLNSPESPIYHKGQLLYNLHQARQAIRLEEQVLLVEGYFDVLRLVLAGVENVVAPLGTALTPDQAALLRRAAPEAVLLYDSDLAGLRATFRAGDELLRHQVRVRVATMPEGDDPDTLVRNGGAAALTPILRDAIDLMERKLQLLDRRGWLGDLEHRRRALDRLLPTVRAAADPITRELYLSLVASRLEISQDVLRAEIERRTTREPHPTPSVQRSPAPPAARGERASADRQLLRILLAAPEWAPRAREEIEPDWLEPGPVRDLFAALTGSGTTPVLPDGLSPEAQRLWTGLKEEVDAGSVPEPDLVYPSVYDSLAARPLLYQYDQLRTRIGSAMEQDQSELTTRLRALGEDIKRRFPREWEKFFFRKPARPIRRTGGKGTPNAS